MKTQKNRKTASLLLAVGLPLIAVTAITHAAPVALQNSTATYSQYEPGFGWLFSVDTAINGSFADGLGWSIANYTPDLGADGGTFSETAVFETVENVGSTNGSILTFKLVQAYGAQHTIGRFRLSVTSDDRSTFADGLMTGGNVSANWTMLDPGSFTSANGAILTKLGDLSIRASGPVPATDTYMVKATTTVANITGFRLEVLEDPALPYNGPGRNPGNGNLTLSEFSADYTPAPDLNIYTAVEICWPSKTNVTYQVQWSSSLSSTNWVNLGSPILATSTNTCIFDSTRDQSRRYYRLIK